MKPIGHGGDKIYLEDRSFIKYQTKEAAEAAYRGMYALARYLGMAHPDWLQSGTKDETASS